MKRISRRGWDVSLLDPIIEKLATDADPRTLFKDYPLKGKFLGCRDCHVTSVNGEMSFDLTQMTNYRTEMRQTTERNCAKLPNAMDAFGDNMIYYSPK